MTPAAATLIDGLLAEQVCGVGIYAFWNDLIFASMMEGYYGGRLNHR